MHSGVQQKPSVIMAPLYHTYSDGTAQDNQCKMPSRAQGLEVFSNVAISLDWIPIYVTLS